MWEAMENPGSGREGPGALRRRWSDAEKRRIVAESYQPGFCVGCGAAQRRERQAGVQLAAPVSRAGWRGQRLVPVVVEPPPLDAAAGDAPAAGRMKDGGKVAWKPGEIGGRRGGSEVYRREDIELRAGDRTAGPATMPAWGW